MHSIFTMLNSKYYISTSETKWLLRKNDLQPVKAKGQVQIKQ